ncbi:MAG: hypothetical protein Q7R95_04550 [bacterium]|nr:hypothetical protein [bacterium]
MDLPNRQSIRLNNYDYSHQGYYYITICTYQRMYLFGTIKNDQMVLNQNGNIILSVWKSLPDHHNIELDKFQIMPNHIHGIIIIRLKSCGSHQKNSGGLRPAPTLGMIVGFLKSESTKQIRKYIVGATRGSPVNERNTYVNRGSPDTIRYGYNMNIWQRNYYEHIIRNEKELYSIRQYIINNPKNWKNDEY